jgi:hypothetical protein
MDSESRHLSVVIDRPAADVYRYASEPANLPAWAAGLASGIRCENGRWYADSPMGTIEIAMAAQNRFGVLDHDVITADGSVMSNPMRVVPAGAGSEVIFTARRRDLTDTEFDRDTAAVLADLQTLKTIMEDER